MPSSPCPVTKPGHQTGISKCHMDTGVGNASLHIVLAFRVIIKATLPFSDTSYSVIDHLVISLIIYTLSHYVTFLNMKTWFSLSSDHEPQSEFSKSTISTLQMWKSSNGNKDLIWSKWYPQRLSGIYTYTYQAVLSKIFYTSQ